MFVAVTTCPRPDGVSYLDETLRSLASEVAVFNDVERKGSRWNTWRAIKSAAFKGDRLLLVQDDVVACKNFALFARRCDVPSDVGVVTFSSFSDDFLDLDLKYIHEEPPPGAYKFPAHRFGSRGMEGAQALLFPAASVAFLAAQDPWHPEIVHRGPHNADFAIGWHVARSPQPLKLVHVPALVHHVGERSACHEETRKRFGWAMPAPVARPLDFDCLTLLEK
jgi:hypothetical protein